MKKGGREGERENVCVCVCERERGGCSLDNGLLFGDCLHEELDGVHELRTGVAKPCKVADEGGGRERKRQRERGRGGEENGENCFSLSNSHSQRKDTSLSSSSSSSTHTHTQTHTHTHTHTHTYLVDSFTGPLYTTLPLSSSSSLSKRSNTS